VEASELQYLSQTLGQFKRRIGDNVSFLTSASPTKKRVLYHLNLVSRNFLRPKLITHRKNKLVCLPPLVTYTPVLHLRGKQDACHLGMSHKGLPFSGNTKGGSITVLLTSCLTGLELAVRQLTIFVLICKTD